MIAIIVHGYAHRLEDNGVMTSSPVHGLTMSKDFIPREASAMNLSGGDYEKIRSDLKSLSIFGQRTELLPKEERQHATPRFGGVRE